MQARPAHLLWLSVVFSEALHEGGTKMKTLSSNSPTISNSLSRKVLFFLLAPGLVAVLFFNSGCKKKQPLDARPEITLQNLGTAYTREMRISREYLLFSQNAEKNHYRSVAGLFKAASRSEEIHAEMAAALMRSKGMDVKPYVPDSIAVGTVAQTLHLAESDEGLETESMFPNLLHTAEIEKFPEAIESFRKALNADLRHAELFKSILNKGASPQVDHYYVCPCCGYIITSETVEECPGCHEKKDKFEKI
jgi:rubrerythrin